MGYNGLAQQPEPEEEGGGQEQRYCIQRPTKVEVHSFVPKPTELPCCLHRKHPNHHGISQVSDLQHST